MARKCEDYSSKSRESTLPFSTLPLLNRKKLRSKFDLEGTSWTWFYLPMQKVLKMRFRMSSLVVAPVISSRGRRAL